VRRVRPDPPGRQLAVATAADHVCGPLRRASIAGGRRELALFQSDGGSHQVALRSLLSSMGRSSSEYGLGCVCGDECGRRAVSPQCLVQLEASPCQVRCRPGRLRACSQTTSGRTLRSGGQSPLLVASSATNRALLARVPARCRQMLASTLRAMTRLVLPTGASGDHATNVKRLFAPHPHSRPGRESEAGAGSGPGPADQRHSETPTIGDRRLYVAPAK